MNENKGEVKKFFKDIIIILLVVTALRACIVEPYKIPSGSMLNTLLIGDRVLATKFNYGLRFPFVKKSLFRFRDPKRGDIVVFSRPDEVSTPNEDESKINIVKRAVGIPGDVIELKGSELFINGSKYDEPYAIYSNGGNVGNKKHFGPYTVPKDHVFLLGDNRDASRDSRFWEYNFLHMDLIKGKAMIIFYNFKKFTRTGKILR